jgi:hypothetical protein
VGIEGAAAIANDILLRHLAGAAFANQFALPPENVKALQHSFSVGHIKLLLMACREGPGYNQ